jgi:hypothetical protein
VVAVVLLTNPQAADQALRAVAGLANTTMLEAMALPQAQAHQAEMVVVGTLAAAAVAAA